MINSLVATTEHMLPPDTRISSEAIFVESPSPKYEQDLIDTVNEDFDVSLVREVYCGDCGGVVEETTPWRKNPFDPEESEKQYRRNPFIGLLLIPIKVGVKVLVAVVKIFGRLFAKVGKALIKIVPKAAKAGVKVAKKGAKAGARVAKKGFKAGSKLAKKMLKKAMKASKKIVKEFDEYLEEREREALISEKVSLQTKLETLKKLKEKGTITPEAYAEAVAGIA